jgi:hypothetical protein
MIQIIATSAVIASARVPKSTNIHATKTIAAASGVIVV